MSDVVATLCHMTEPRRMASTDRRDTDRPEWFEDFMQSRTRMGRSPHTLRALRQDFDAIATLILGGSDDLSVLEIRQVTKRSIQRAFSDYADTHRSNSYLRCWSTWNQLCDWLIDNDYLNRINPMRTVERRRPERHHPKSLTAEEIGKLIDAAWQENNPPRSWPELEHAVVAVGVLTGVREAELISLNINSIRHTEQGPVLHVRGKGSKDRSIPFEPELLQIIETYLQSRTQVFRPRASARRDTIDRFAPDEPLFVGADGERITVGTLQSRVGRLFKRAGVPTKPGALLHSLRHTYATALADTGINPYQLRTLLGHESAETSQRYIAAAGQENRGAAARNPLYAQLGRTV